MHYRVFDCWRFVAAMLVMTYHYLYWAPGGGDAAIAILRHLLPLLDLFFMISGFFITTRYADRLRDRSDVAGFLRRRMARLYPLHLITTLFFVAVALVALAADADHYPYAAELQALPYHLLGLHALGLVDSLDLNYVSWSVSAEFFSYLMFPLLVVILRYGGLKSLAAALAGYLLVLEILSQNGVFPSGHWTSADTFGAYRAFADFTIGAVIAQIVATVSMPRIGPWPGVASLALAVLWMLLGAPWYLSLAQVALSVLLSAIAETQDPQVTRRLQFAMPVTCAAFGIYIWHPVMEILFLTVLWARWLEALNVVPFALYVLLPMGMTVAVAVYSAHCVEPKLGRLIAGRERRAARADGRLASA